MKTQFSLVSQAVLLVKFSSISSPSRFGLFFFFFLYLFLPLSSLCCWYFSRKHGLWMCMSLLHPFAGTVLFLLLVLSCSKCIYQSCCSSTNTSSQSCCLGCIIPQLTSLCNGLFNQNWWKTANPEYCLQLSSPSWFIFLSDSYYSMQLHLQYSFHQKLNEIIVHTKVSPIKIL